MLKAAIHIIAFFIVSSSFSQNPKPDKLKAISLADTVFFTVTTSGCFDAGTILYKLVRQKNTDHLVTFQKKIEVFQKKISQKNYDVFMYRFRQSAQRFKYADENEKKCTLTTYFKLSDNKQSVDFSNTSCEAEFNPEEILKQLMK